MDLKTVRTKLSAFPHATEETPFGPEALVYKIGGKMFALVAWQESPLRLTLKCDPHRALALRGEHAAVLPGYHMNKRHWNTIILDGSVEPDVLDEWMRESYRLVVRGLPKSTREDLLGDT